MFSPRWRKMLSDVWGSKTRTFLVVLSIAAGVFAVGTVVHMSVIVSSDLDESYASINPASAVIYTADLFDDDVVQTIRRTQGVREAEGRRTFIARQKLPEGKTWYPIQFLAVSDYDDMRINIIRPELEFGPDPVSWPNPGVLPPPPNELVLERTSLLTGYQGLLRAKLGGSLLIEMPGGKQREMRMAGLVYDFARIPATFAGMAYGYITLDTLEWLGEPRGYNELYIVVTGDTRDTEHIQRIADQVKTKIEKGGIAVIRTNVPEPGKLPLDSYFQSITLILGALGIVSLFLSTFLVINTVSALLAQQTRQIGVMKAVGARTSQLVGMYLTLVAIFGLLSLVIAVPAGARGAQEFINFLSYFLNFQLSVFQVPPLVIAFEVAMALVVPLLAALYPVYNGARITVREAIASYGLGQGKFGASWIDRLLERVRGLPRPILISLRNTFRRKGRIAMTLGTLILASAFFVAVMSVRASLMAITDQINEYWQYDVEFQFNRSYRIAQIENIVLNVPGVAEAESWHQQGTFRVRPDGSEGSSLFITALPADTGLFKPTVLEGRWLAPGDENAIIITPDVVKDEPDIQVGDDITLNIQDRDYTWNVVGIVRGMLSQPIAYANRPYFTRTILRDVGRTSNVRLVTERHDAEFQTEIARTLQEQFEDNGLEITYSQTIAQTREQNEVFFNILTTFLMSMAILMAAVGGLGLMGTMSLNVIERTREIGVMRAIGASDNAVMQIVMVEGVLLGVISWVGGVLLALPLGAFLNYTVGMQFFNLPLDYTFSVDGALIWLGAIMAIAAAASYLPAQRASRLTIREVLVYE